MAPANEEKPDHESRAIVESAASCISTQMTDRELWWEVMAVLAIGVFPWLCSAYVGVIQPREGLHYWLESLYLSFRSFCISLPVLYLIYRSREPWKQFGITRPRFTDILLALVLTVGAAFIWAVESRVGLASFDQQERFYRSPTQVEHYAMMVITYAASGFAEELVTRAYLITRLEYLLKSPAKAVIVSAAAFASYHIYYGLPSLIYFITFGLMFGAFFLLVRRIWPLALAHMLCNIWPEILIP